MSKYKDMAKSKWQEKPGGSIRGHVSGLTHRSEKPGGGGIRGHVSGLANRAHLGSGSSSNDAPVHEARPISQLRDPSSFAPPPRRTGSGLAPAPPPTSAKRSVVPAPSKYQDPRRPEPQQIEYDPAYDQEEEEVAAPRGPYRANTTGLETNHLPPPPGRRDGADGRTVPPAPPSYETATRQPPPKPGLPPRLPARTSASSAASSPAPSDTSAAAAQRLGAAGVSVPSLGIGSDSHSQSASPPLPGRSSEGTTFAQKQAAVRTASSFQKDPSSVSMSDARSALGTANNFRQRHGEQMAAGARGAANLDQKYGISNKVGGIIGSQQQQQEDHPPASPQGGVQRSATVAAAAAKKKPPPPPPKKKPALTGGSVASASPSPAPQTDDGGAPPPVPLATRPTF